MEARKYVTDAFKVALTGRTNVETKPEAYETSVPRVFTAGDMHRGQSLVVWAIREGREAARAVDESLDGIYKSLIKCSKKEVDKDHAGCYNTCMNKGVLLEGNPPKVRPFFIYF